MVRFWFLLIFGACLIVSCISPGTRAEIDKQAQRIVLIEKELSKAIHSGASQEEVQKIQYRLNAAEDKFVKLQEKGEAERQEISGKIQQAITKGDYIGAALITVTTIAGSMFGYKQVQKKRKSKGKVTGAT